MKIKSKNLINIFITILIVTLMLCGFVLTAKNNKNFKVTNQTLFAATEYDSQTEIVEDGQVISESLWNALKVFYNNNKTDEMPRIKTNEEGLQYLTINQFKDFPIDILDLSGEEINKITNLSIFDLSSFTEINLSNNKITNINNELSNLENLQIINLSNNELQSFSYDSLHQRSYGQNLQKLDLSHNQIVECNLRGINQGEIDVRDNKITKDRLNLPNNLDVKVLLSHNLIESPNLSNDNIKFGFQGAKNTGSYEKHSSIGYYGLDGVEKVEVYFLSVDENDETQFVETKIVELYQSQTYTFELGYYKIKFNNANYDDINIYIAPKAPEIKMFKNGEEIEFNHQITSAVELKFYGDENATFVYSVNSNNFVEGNSVKLTTPGVKIIVVYQIIDGYQSFASKVYIEYIKNSTNGIVFVIAGIAIFAVFFYLAIKYMPQLSKLKFGKNKDKNNLD